MLIIFQEVLAMSTNYTVTLSLGSGERAEELAVAIKNWAYPRPISTAIRALLEKEIKFKSKK